MSGTGIAFDLELKKHDTGPGHPEQPARLTAVINKLESTGLLQQLKRIPSRSAVREELELVHTGPYIDLVSREVSQNRRQLSTGDTDINPQSDVVARLAAGSVLSAVDAVFEKSATTAFCAVRPPGHHASAARGMGFCLYNNIALAARYAQKRFGAERVLIVDWDVHHGNGTQDIFYQDGSVLFFSTHQSPWYPGTGARNEQGEGKGEGKIINCPFRAGAGRSEILGAVRELLIPAADAFHPDLILLSAGFDSRLGDPLGQFTLEDRDFSDLTSMMRELAGGHCQDRLVSVLEGGYSLEGLASAVEAHVRTLHS
jgi:acetoin utilization deacetylase AcuC-like enzyme